MVKNEQTTVLEAANFHLQRVSEREIMDNATSITGIQDEFFLFLSRFYR